MRKQKEELNNNPNEPKDYSHEFYNILTVKINQRFSIKDKQILNQRFEICQVIRDIITISESTNWNLRASTEAKYRSIGSLIKKIDQNSEEYENIKNQIIKSYVEINEELEIINIYGLLRPTESIKYNESLTNKRQLFHGTKSRNIVGILSRGLLLPNYIVDEIGINRSDVGMLGNGIYFSDCINTSLKYTNLNKSRNTRLVAICDVALGNCKDYNDFDTTLNEAPKNYNSTHGVKGTKFNDDEYVIYDICQQKIKYLIELKYNKDGEIILSKNETEKMQIETEKDEVEVLVDLNEIDRLEKGKNILDKQESGLQTSDGESIPLKSIHIRVQLLDMVSKVNIFQEYENKENYPIEAKYIFPLDDNSAICGFEAFINDKHVIGVCKEKEQAHKEYKEAIEKGHGAYLMDQESNELFKVNIGNLPSMCKCIIKITYVAELNVENENIIFRLPNYIASWQTFNYKNEKLHDDKNIITKCFNSLEMIKSTTNKNLSLQISIQMPFEIRKITSPTHSIDIKQTTCNAVVKLGDRQNLNETFLLNVSMSAIHVPRMLVEDNSSCLHTRACMLSFYPEFETNKIKSPNVVFLLDSSNSMSTDSFKYAKKLLFLMLRKLPQNCFFNVISFGSTFQELFPFSVSKNESIIERSFNFINKVKPNSGNTDLLNSIQSFILLKSNELINFVLISDGHINQIESLISTLNKPNQSLRFFNCAVGSNPNKYFLKMISYITNGSFEQFDSQFQSKWKDKVEDLIDKLCQPPALGNISVDWQTNNNNNFDNKLQAPIKINSLFNGRRQVVYGFVQNCLLATLKANLDDQEVSTVVNCPDLMITKGTIIHKLTAKALINDWQYGILSNDRFNNEIIKSKLKTDIIHLSKEYSITSEYTSFIAIEERDDVEINKKSCSTTPSIDSLLEKDLDAVSIDILPYMAYTNEEEDKQVIENSFQKMLTQIYDNFENIEENEKHELSLLLYKNKDIVSETYSENHPNRLKYNHLMMKDLIRRNLNDQANEIGEKILNIDEISSEYDYIIQQVKFDLNNLPKPVNGLFIKTLTGKTISLSDLGPRSTIGYLKCKLQGIVFYCILFLHYC